ncbi:unnamed protein product [Linum tenue]|uniref:QWRF motif-containing protein 2 n=1 Tax=Linum tenue TaxID=586396 RepID=A0AAV0MZU3_9ROSI|nr:unnamed protein product [Linum tenue]
MVAAVSAQINPPKPRPTPQNQNPTRPPLLPSESDNALAPRRPKPREVTSRYMSSSSSSSSAAKRCPSPLISRPKTPTKPSVPARSQSVERRRSATPSGRSNSADLRIANGAGEMTNAQKLLITSTRSLSVSFQGGSFALQVSKAKPAPSPVSARKGTPERRRATPPRTDQVENHNSRSAEQKHRWPGRLREPPNSMNRSVDCTDDRKRAVGSGVSVNVVRALHRLDSRSSIESRLSSDSSNVVEPEKLVSISGSEAQSDPPFPSDTESVSSGTTSEGSSNAGGQVHKGGHGIIVPARFWQENNNRIRRQPPEPSSPSKFAASRTISLQKIMPPRKLGIESPVSSPKGVFNMRGQSSPFRRPASPSKIGTVSAMATPARGMSPSRMRNSMGSAASNFGNTSTLSILSFGADLKRVKGGETRLVEVHHLRILYNRLLQWRFVNARADASLSVQSSNAEVKSLHCAHVATTRLRESVRTKRTELQWLRHNLKLITVLRGQMQYLEAFALMEQNYSCSLSGAIEALQASTLRLPVVSGARADTQNVKDAIYSAVDVMQAMGSSLRSLLAKVGEMNSLVSELGSMSAKELSSLDECRDLLATLSAIQVKECSLRAHITQLQALRPCMETEM